MKHKKNKKNPKDKTYSILYNNLVTDSFDRQAQTSRQTTLSTHGEIMTKEQKEEAIS
jgi:hypothetical protein